MRWLLGEWRVPCWYEWHPDSHWCSNVQVRSKLLHNTPSASTYKHIFGRKFLLKYKDFFIVLDAFIFYKKGQREYSRSSTNLILYFYVLFMKTDFIVANLGQKYQTMNMDNMVGYIWGRVFTIQTLLWTCNHLLKEVACLWQELSEMSMSHCCLSDLIF